MAEKKITTEQPRPRTVRGTATIHLDDRIEFKPYAEGESTQKNVKECLGAKSYETTSEKSPLKVAHLTCPANAADPWQVYNEQLERLGIKPLTPKQQPQNQRLMCEDRMEVWLNQSQGRLTYAGIIELSQSRNWQADLVRQMQLVVRTLPANEKFKKIINKLKKEKNV